MEDKEAVFYSASVFVRDESEWRQQFLRETGISGEGKRMNKECLAGNALLDEKIKIFHKNQNTDTYVDVMKQMAVTMQKDGHFIVLSAKEETICNAYRLHVVDDCI